MLYNYNVSDLPVNILKKEHTKLNRIGSLFFPTFSLMYRKKMLNPILKQNVYLGRVVAGVFQIACFAICNL